MLKTLAAALLWPMSWILLPLAVAGTQITTCSMGDYDSWSASLFIYSPVLAIVLGLLFVLQRERPVVVWLAIPHLILVPWMVVYVLPYLLRVTIFGGHPCSVLTGDDFDDYSFPAWQRLWAPLEISLLSLTTYLTVPPLAKAWKGKAK